MKRASSSRPSAEMLLKKRQLLSDDERKILGLNMALDAQMVSRSSGLKSLLMLYRVYSIYHVCIPCLLTSYATVMCIFTATI